MQGYKKPTDGQSDSSSLGSLLDDTDREVCSLTDRAFKSLCVAELETSYTESNPVVSPHIPHHFSNKFIQGPLNHAIKRNAVANKLLSKTKEHSTFQQILKDTQEDKKAVTISTPNIRRKLGLPVPGLCNYKVTSKVSSLIKTFDQAEKPESGIAAKQAGKNTLPTSQLAGGCSVAPWGGQATLSIQEELSASSDACQDVANPRHQRHNTEDLVCQGPHGFHLPQGDISNIRKSSVSTSSRKTVKTKAKEPARQGHFLHSENSAFESWNAHHQKLVEMGGSTENLTYIEEAPFFRESCMPEHKPLPIKVAAPGFLRKDFSPGAFPQKPRSQAPLSPVSLSQRLFPPLSVDKDTVAQTLSSPVSASKVPEPPSLTPKGPFPPTRAPQATASPVPISKAPIPPPSLPRAPTPSEAVSQCADTEAVVPQIPQKTDQSECKLQLENTCPPWRRQKPIFQGMEMTHDIATAGLTWKNCVHRVLSDVSPLTETAASESHVAPSDVSAFNITTLLTPVLPPKQEKESSDGQSFLVTPPISEAGGIKGSEEKAHFYSQNHYKSKAPSLLFNLKDIRKRVKSTYSPSPLLRTLDDKKKISEQDSIKASVTAPSLLESNGGKPSDNEEANRKPEQMDSGQGKDRPINVNGHLTDHFLIPRAPWSKENTSHDQGRNRLWQDSPVDVEDYEMVSVTEFCPNEHSVSQPSPSRKSCFVDATAEPEVSMQMVHFQDSKNKKVAPSQSADTEPQVSPNLFFTAEENTNNYENPATENESRGKRSPSSSEQSFVSVIDQPFHEEPFSLMQLFHKACLQESQRSKDEMSGEEKLSSKEKEKAGRKEEPHGLGNCHSNTDRRCDEKEEQHENENALKEGVMKEKREERWKDVDSASEERSEEPLTPTSSSSFKPNFFMIKDNTFKSPPVIKALKLPLLRSFSCEDTMAGSHMESEKQGYGSTRATPNIQEMDWSLARSRGQQSAKDAAVERDTEESGSNPASMGYQMPEKSHQIAERILRGELQNSYTQGLVGDGEGGHLTATLLRKEGKGSEKRMAREREKSRAGRVRPSSTSQLNLDSKGEPVQSKQRHPPREKTNYFKKNLVSKGRSGPCVKKIIVQETRSPLALEAPTQSSASGDAYAETSAASGYLARATGPSPRSDSTAQSAFTSPLSDTTATCSTAQDEKMAKTPSLHGVTENRDHLSPVETSDPTQMRQLSGDADSPPGTNERLQLMGRMAKTAAKPPAVPPKTEKALRRAKKLASRRRKTEAQQKKVLMEPPSPSGDVAPLSSVPSPLSLAGCNSPVAPSESDAGRLQPLPAPSPTPSLPPATQRKLLQDPDSGEYFIVDVPIQLKTFYDPESGRYIQVSLPSSKRNLSQTPSSEISPSSYVLYPTAVPLRVSSVPTLPSPSRFLEPASLTHGACLESASDWQPDGQYPEPPESRPYIEPASPEVHSRDADVSQYNFEKDVGLSANGDIISMGAIEDFAVEGIS